MDKIYLGKLATKELKFGKMLSGYLNVTDIPKDKIKTSKSGKKYISIDVFQLKNVDDYGNSHSIQLNTFEPQKKEEFTDDMPF